MNNADQPRKPDRTLALRNSVVLITGAASGIECREPRVIVGADAIRASWVQRIFPVSYWKLAARDIARRAGKGVRL